MHHPRIRLLQRRLSPVLLLTNPSHHGTGDAEFSVPRILPLVPQIRPAEVTSKRLPFLVASHRLLVLLDPILPHHRQFPVWNAVENALAGIPTRSITMDVLCHQAAPAPAVIHI